MKKTIRILLVIFTVTFLAPHFSDNTKEKMKGLIRNDNFNYNKVISNTKEPSINSKDNKLLAFIDTKSILKSKENKYFSIIDDKMSYFANTIKDSLNSGIEKDNTQKDEKNNKNKVFVGQKETKEPKQVEPKTAELTQVEDTKILSNKTSKTLDEIDRDMKYNHRTLYTSDSVRQSMKTEIYEQIGKKNIKTLNRKLSATYYVLTQVLDNDKYKQLINKENENWDSYTETNLYNSIDYLKEAIEIAKNSILRNDLKRAYDLCVYGINDNDVIALIDARRIIGDIESHIFSSPSKTGVLSLVESSKEQTPDLYYGASELLESEDYHLIGVYRYNIEDINKDNLQTAK